MITVKLTTLPALTKLNLAKNNIFGKILVFNSNLDLKTAGSPIIGKVITNSNDQNPPTLVDLHQLGLDNHLSTNIPIH